MSIVRSSKFRHINGAEHKSNYAGIKITKSAIEATFCAVNPKFVAVVLAGAGGGPFLVLPLEKFGRVPTTPATVNGHKDKVIELAWSPFNDNLIASSAEDNLIMLWQIPDEGLTEHLTEPLQTLEGHSKKPNLLEWHPTAENILASGGQDNIVFVWKVEEGEAVIRLDHPNIICSLAWNYNGSLLATTCKDKTLRVYEPRKGEIVQEKAEFVEGTKTSKCVFLKDGRIFTVGFSKMSTRIYALWDSKNLKTPLTCGEIDQANGVIYLHCDTDNNVIFLAGKGDSVIRYFEVTNEDPYVFYLTQYSSTASQKGIGWMPKRGLDVTTCEIARCYRLQDPEKCSVVSLVVPRKSELFQRDIYPDCKGYEPSMTADEWYEGKNANPITMSTESMFQAARAGKGGSVRKPKKAVKILAVRSSKPAGGEEVELTANLQKMQATLSKVCKRLVAVEKKLGINATENLE